MPNLSSGGRTIVPEPGVKPKAPSTDVLRARLDRADQPAKHLWIIMGVWTVDPLAWEDGADPVLLDTENMISIEGPGCFKCERAFSNRLARRPCRGSTK